MKKNKGKAAALSLILSIIMAGSAIPSSYVQASSDSSSYAGTETAAETEPAEEPAEDTENNTGDAENETAGTVNELSSFLYKDKDGKEKDEGTSVVLDNENGFASDDRAVLTRPDDKELEDAENALSGPDNLPGGFDTADSYIISVVDSGGDEITPEGDTEVRLYLPDDAVRNLDGTQLFHIGDETERLDYDVYTEEAKDDDGKTREKQYISFKAGSFSPFLFVTPKEAAENADEDTSSETAVTQDTAKEDVLESADEEAADNKEDGDNAAAAKKAPAADALSPIYIRELSTQLFYGATKQDDGTYLWNADKSASGHRFSFRIRFALSGQGEAGAGTVTFTIPKNVLKDRSGNNAGAVEWSIPTRDDVISSARDKDGNSYNKNKEGYNEADAMEEIINGGYTFDPDEIDEESNYAVYEDGDNYVIYNFRSVPAADNGYFELAYSMTKSTFSYIDMGEMNPFTCVMQIGDGTDENTKKEAAPITVKINTGAQITGTYKQYPYSGKIKSWNSSWGDSVKPENPEDYYYLVWTIRSDISATQPYDFKIDDNVVTGNLGGMTVLGVRYSGESTFTKAHSVTNQTSTGSRYDQILTAIPLSLYENAAYWKAENTETATVTPSDKVDKETSRSSSQTWEWSKPVWQEPSGHFNLYKRADGAYRSHSNIYSGTTHIADSLSMRAGRYSRYDLESFDGFDGAEKTLSDYGGFDYASWMAGYPYQWTKDTSSSSYNEEEPWTAYGKKPVKYELTDDGVYLSGSESNENAVKLTSEDFEITKLGFSWYMSDADYESEETGTWRTKQVSYTDGDVLTFEGKFNGSDEWVTFAAYDIKNGKANPVDAYVDSMSGSEITFKDGQKLTAYRVTTVNSHYFTEVFTVPTITLHNTDTVLNALDGSRHLSLVNNNTGNFYQLKDGVSYADADYQTLSGNADNWTKILTASDKDTDYAEASEKNSSLKKEIISTANNTRRRFYTITWHITQGETITTGENGDTSYIPQDGGILYDLLPEGAVYVSGSLAVYGGGKALDESAYTVQAIPNYRGSGRTMLVIRINDEASYYSATYDTRHSWNSIKDYGTNVKNPVAYETGNDSITNGSADTGGTSDKDLMSDLSKRCGITNETETGKKFLYAENSWDISTLISASSGLTKKVKAGTDRSYSYETKTQINGDYTYELRFLNSNTTGTKNIILFDSLENYDASTMTDGGTESDWRGTLSSVDISQLKEKGAAPVIYISEKDVLDPETGHDLTDSSVWTKVDDPTDTASLSKAKAVAIDIRKKTDGSDFIVESTDSIVAYLYMKAPATAVDPKEGEDYPYAYNNIYMADTVMSEDGESGTDFFVHQDYTRVSLFVTGDVKLSKVSSKTGNAASGITFRLYGTSDYGTEIDTQKKTGSSGSLSFNDIEKGTYVLQETDATDDFLLDSTQHKVVIDKDGRTWIDDKDCTDNPAVIENTPRVHADVSFRKTDSIFTSTRIPGAVYRLSGKSDYGTDVLMTAASMDADGEDSTNKGLVTFSNVEKGKYTLKETKAPDGYVLDDTEYTVTVDDDGNVRIDGKERDVYSGSPATKYSHTPNISDNGTQNGNYGSSLNLHGSSYVVTIPDAQKVHVKITWGGESSSYDWACMWAGSHPDYTAYSNYSSSVTGRLGGGNHTSSSNTKEYDVDGDTVTFAFRSDGSGYGDGYGYYAIVTDADYKKTGTTTEAEKESGIYKLEDEPLHYIAFTKKSSYDKSIVGGAQFSLTGTADNGTAINMDAQSDDETGTVRFESLPSGIYVLTETKAPDGYEENDGKYAVQVKDDGTYTISSLTKTGDVYDLYNTKKQDKQITITKVWDDGITTHAPSELAMTIQTDVPEQSLRTYTVSYNANGGSFSGKDTNTVTYNAKNEVTSGSVGEPTPPADYYAFKGWAATKANADRGTVDFYPTPNDTTNASLTSIKNGETKTVYAVWKDIRQKYAVMIYGIGQDTLQDGSTGGITFGPATGKNYVNTVGAHTVDDSTHVQTDEDTDTGHHNVITGDDAGTDESGNAYRCLHYDNWKTIIYWNNVDPHVYDECIGHYSSDGKTWLGDCTHAVVLKPSKAAQEATFTGTSVQSGGDGVSMLGGNAVPWMQWNSQYSTSGGYAASRARAVLIGKQGETGSAAGDTAKYTADTCILSAFPQELQNAIGARKVGYATSYSGYGNGRAAISYVYDKLWLFSNDEIYGNVPSTYGSNYGNYFNYYTSDGIGESGRAKGSGQYQRTQNMNLVANTNWSYQNQGKLIGYNNSSGAGNWWLRSLYGYIYGNASYVRYYGSLYYWSAYNNGGLAPGFVLERSA